MMPASPWFPTWPRHVVEMTGPVLLPHTFKLFHRHISKALGEDLCLPTQETGLSSHWEANLPLHSNGHHPLCQGNDKKTVRLRPQPDSSTGSESLCSEHLTDGPPTLHLTQYLPLLLEQPHIQCRKTTTLLTTHAPPGWPWWTPPCLRRIAYSIQGFQFYLSCILSSRLNFRRHSVHPWEEL